VTATATGLRPAPPVGRDRVAMGWVAAVAASAFGDTAWLVALAWTAVHVLDPAAAGLVVGVGTLPQAALMLTGGVLADRHDPRRVVAAGETGRAAVLVAGALAWWADAPAVVVLPATALGLGAVAGLSQPALQTMTRLLVPPDDLPTVMGWSQVAQRLARLGGAPVGAWLVVAAGPATTMLLDAATFAAVAVVAATVRARFALPRTTAHGLVAVRQALHHLRTTPRTRALVLGICGLNVFTAPALTLGVPLRVSGAGWSAGWLGAAEAAFATGAILGSLAALRRRPERLAASGFAALVVQGLAIALLAVPSRPVLLTATGLLGVTAGLASVWISAAFIATVDPGYLGRVSSVTTLGDLLVLPVAVPLFGALAGWAGLATAAVTFGAGMSVLCAVLSRRPELRRIRA
jgi:MFS family permease